MLQHPKLGLLFSLILFPALPGFLSAQQVDRGQDLLMEAQTHWDEGRFVDALEILEGILLGPDADRLKDQVALLTGELFPVVELAADGGSVRWGPRGSLAAFETGSASDPVTRVVSVEGGQVKVLAQVQGSDLVFSPSQDRAVYLRVDETPELVAERARLAEELGGSDRAARNRLRTELQALDARYTRVVTLDLPSGRERATSVPGLAIQGLLMGPGGGLHVLGMASEDGLGPSDDPQVFRIEEDGKATQVSKGPGEKSDPFLVDGGFLVYGAGRGSFSVENLNAGTVFTFQGSGPVASDDEKTLAWLGGPGEEDQLMVLSLTAGELSPRVGGRIPYPVSGSSSRSCPSCPARGGLALSPDGRWAVVQAMPREDWELFLVPLEESAGEDGMTQITREIQHDLYPVFLDETHLLAVKGEGRHRRSHLYDLETGEATWLFRNNTVRTVAPEYEWAPSPDGSKLLLVAERDGNTVSPERGIYLMDLGTRVTGDQVLARVRDNLAAERELRARAEAMYGPISGEVRAAVDQISKARLFRYQEALYQFGSKNVSQPGNAPAIQYIADQLRTFGYEPELQWFEARGVETANVVARLTGTVSPDVVYAVSAHFDSNTRSPGADDNTSATVGLLEMARVLADHPLPATVEIALFTGEESGLLGSREYVRRAVESAKHLVGALNNDMVGFAEDHRLDNTIRYSNKGIRDLQHGAAILFSDLVTHDAEYYKSTDAAAYYDAYGDIVGGIGSYPILASPHYHQTHDQLETINHQLVTEVAKTTVASAMLMASSPSRLDGLEITRDGTRIRVTWDPAVEKDVVGYVVAYGSAESPLQNRIPVTEATVVLDNLPQGTLVSVRAVNERGMEGWDWARGMVGPTVPDTP